MKIAVIGSGGREHTIAWKLKSCDQVEKVFVIPGNPGMIKTPGIDCVKIAIENYDELLLKIKELEITLVVIGPEGPLDNGIVDFLEKNGVSTLGPSKLAAKMESSKAVSKAFMKKYKIPTAACKVFSQYKEASNYLQSINVSEGIVLKADELAGGKGVVVTTDRQTASDTLYDFMENPNCSVKTKSILFEDLLVGEELSAFALYDGNTYINLGQARDYKRVFDNDQGPNTGGMGTFSEENLVSDEISEKINKLVFTPFLEGMKKDGNPFKGFLFAGLMIDKSEINVIEFNVRFGDPETQVIFPRMKGNIAMLFKDAAESNLKNTKSDFSLSSKSAVHVVMTSKNYPSIGETPMELNHKIKTDEEYFSKKEQSHIFYAGVKENENRELVNSSGRVLGVTAIATSTQEARREAYEGISNITFTGAHFRNDIAK